MPEIDEETDGVQLSVRDKKFSMDANTAKILIRHLGPHLRWIVAAIAWSIGIIGTCYALSLIL